MVFRVIARAILAAGILLSTFESRAEFRRPCLEALFRLKKPKQDSTVELELPLTRDVLRTLTTTDETVGPLLNGKKAPGWLKAKLPFRFPWDPPTDPRTILWRQLTPAEQMRLLAYANHDADYWQRRTIPGLRVRDTILFESHEPFTFRGTEYPAGTHEIPMEGTMGAVEFMSPNDIRRLQEIHRNSRLADDPDFTIGVEFHYRDRKSAGTVSTDAWKLAQKGFRSPEPHQHVHYVRSLLQLLPRGSRPLRVAKTTNFTQRSETLASMHTTLNRGALGTSHAPYDPNVINFSTLSAEDFQELYGVFGEVARGNPRALTSSRFKMGSHGIRGPDAYESGIALIGGEYRVITKPGNIEPENRERYKQNIGAVLDGLQATFEDRHFGLGPDRIRRWLAAGKPHTPISQRIREAYFNEKDFGRLLARAPEVLRQQMAEPYQQARFQELVRYSEGFNMLLHDWSKDPLFFDQPQKLEHILKMQLEAWDWIWHQSGAAPRKPLNDSQLWLAHARLCRFLLDSHIFEEYGASLGVRVKIPPHAP